MPEIEVIAQYVNQPKANPDFGSIKTKDGKFYSVPQAMLAQFRAGQNYRIEYKESEKKDKNGEPYRGVTKILANDAPAQAMNVASSGRYGDQSDATAERIYVCGGLNAFISAGKIAPTVEDITVTTKALRAAWARTFGNKKHDDDMDGESIPY